MLYVFWITEKEVSSKLGCRNLSSPLHFTVCNLPNLDEWNQLWILREGGRGYMGKYARFTLTPTTLEHMVG